MNSSDCCCGSSGLPYHPTMKASHTALPTFRPFTKSDFDSFAGVETDKPLICEFPEADDSTDDFRIECGVIIIDGTTVHCEIATEFETDNCSRTLTDAEQAMQYAQQIIRLTQGNVNRLADFVQLLSDGTYN